LFGVADVSEPVFSVELNARWSPTQNSAHPETSTSRVVAVWSRLQNGSSEYEPEVSPLQGRPSC
jgi:hypothetical protein